MKADTDQRLMLAEVTEGTANAAVRVIASYATDRADLELLLRMVAPSPHSPDSGPVRRRATPRTTR